MNVAFITDSLPPIIDGVARCVVEYAREFQNGGHGKCIVIAPHIPGSEEYNYPFPIFRFSSVPLPKMDYRAGYPFMPSLVKKIRELDIDIIHAHSPFTAMTISKKLRKKFNIPIVYTQHTKWEFDIARAVGIPAVAKALEKFIYKNINSADDVWAVSKKTGEHIKTHGFKGDFIVRENGTDFPKSEANQDFIKDINKKYGLNEDIPVLLFVGRMMWYKNQMLTFNALEILKNKGFDFKMIFVGDGRDLEDMEKIVREKKLHEQVFFAGRINDRELLRAYYTRANIFVIPSTYDNAPLVIREAAACCCPSLVIRESSASEILEEFGENQTAFFADENPESIAECIIESFGDKERYRLVRKNAADKVYLPWSKVIVNSIAGYEEICENYKSKNKK